MLRVAPLAPDDHDRWHVLARGYKTFYETVLPDVDYDAAWARLLAGNHVYGIGASIDGELLGIAHYLFHTSTWTPTVCYLQDLFVDPAARGIGVARQLIEQVAIAARAQHATRLYWLTAEHNATARALYDKVARFHGFIRYDYPLG